MYKSTKRKDAARGRKLTRSEYNAALNADQRILLQPRETAFDREKEMQEVFNGSYREKWPTMLQEELGISMEAFDLGLKLDSVSG